jgi:hypothetical protein
MSFQAYPGNMPAATGKSLADFKKLVDEKDLP